MKPKYIVIRGLILAFLLLPCYIESKNLQGEETEVFSVPENLEDNVAFWKKIYTEVSLKEGIIHDNEYPLIIYKKVIIGDREGRNRSQFIRYHKNQVIQALKVMRRKHSSRWNSTEQEIARLFETHASKEELESAWKRVRFQQGQRERYKQGLERSGAYMAFIRLMFKIYNIPDRIAYLPHVESSFNINAYSRVGAAGMWQFMRQTARIFGLKIDYKIDERRDPIKSTVAAAALLKKNYNELKSWPLAITAYNHGLASIIRAVRVTGSQDIGVIIEKYKNRRFRFASKNFYGCFLAASEIAANAETYFPDINYHPPLQYHEIQLENYLRPKTIEQHLGVSQEQIKELNPALRSIVFSQQLPIPRDYKLRIPTSLPPQEANEKLGGIPVTEIQSAPNTQQYYTVRRGDTLYNISRRFRVPIESLLITNQISSKNRIYIGQVLRVPGKEEKSGSGKETVKPKPAPSKPLESPVVPPKTPDKIPGTIIENTALEKPKNHSADDSFDASIYNLEVKLLQGNEYAIVTVSVDESLGHYAEWLKTSVNKIRSINGWRHSVNFNQKVKIPLKHQLSSLEQFKAQRLEYHLALEEDFYNQYRIVDIKHRVVKYGDTLWSICNKDEEIPIWLLMKYNLDINLHALKEKTRLTIPVIAPKNNGTN